MPTGSMNPLARRAILLTIMVVGIVVAGIDFGNKQPNELINKLWQSLWQSGQRCQ